MMLVVLSEVMFHGGYVRSVVSQLRPPMNIFLQMACQQYGLHIHSTSAMIQVSSRVEACESCD